MKALEKALAIARLHGITHTIRRGSAWLERHLATKIHAGRERVMWSRFTSQVRTEPVFVPQHEKPLVSVVIPVFNERRQTAACLNALLRELGSIPCEFIIVDDGSTDDTAEYLKSCSGVRVVDHLRSEGFAKSANDGAAAARGRYLHFMSTTTLVTPGWMVALLRTFDAREGVGAAGSQVRTAHGTLWEAGAVVWRDGTTESFGRGRKSEDPGIVFPREVDYCSASSLMIRADVFRELGGFSREFDQTKYTAIDFCFRMRAAGYRVMYQPDSIVASLDGNGFVRSTADKRIQNLNREKFAAKWRSTLAGHYPPDADLVERAARRLNGKHTALVIDSFIPFDDRSAGGLRLFSVMRLMRELDWHVVFVAHDGGSYQPYVDRARRAGVEVLPHSGDATRIISNFSPHWDVAWVSRPDLLKYYLPHLRRRSNAAIIYDTVDLHFIRMQREAQLTGAHTDWADMREIELDLARKSDCVVVTSPAEAALLAEEHLPAHVIPIIEQPVQTPRAYSTRQNLFFLGNYTHQPNVDAAMWLVNEIMPRVWERIPNLAVTLAGAEPTPSVQRLAAENVVVTGHVSDIRPMLDGARLFVAPLRFGAGMKGKVVKSLAHSLPVITTDCGAEGIGVIHGESVMIADDAAGFAEAILRVYNDEALWKRLSTQGRRVAAQYAPQAVKPALEKTLNAALNHQHEIGVDVGSSTNPA